MSLLTFEKALQLVLETTESLPTVNLPIEEAAGLYLSKSITSAIDLPRFDNSQMDGYAINYPDISMHKPQSPLILPEVGTAAAGAKEELELKKGTTVRIFTGAPIPRGADTIVPVEDVQRGSDAHVTFAAPIEKGQFVRCKGEDLTSGDVIAKPGDRLTPGRLALLMSAGRGHAAVHRQARVVILTNGDELADRSIAPSDLAHGQIYESNSLMLKELAKDAGADVSGVRTASDSLEEIVQLLQSLIADSRPDLIITTGGVSVGDRDWIRSALKQLGEVIFWRAAIRPGKPILYGKIGSTQFLGLPGNPASTLVTFELFARPLINKLQGNLSWTSFLPSIVSEAVQHEPGRRSFVRAYTTVTAAGLSSKPSGGQGSHFVTSLARANSLIVIPEDTTRLDPGSSVKCLMMGPPTSA